MAKGTTSTPHDAVFKQFLTQADTARDFLAIHLPPALRQRCDLDTLQLESASFIEESLRAWYSDVLWSLKKPPLARATFMWLSNIRARRMRRWPSA